MRGLPELEKNLDLKYPASLRKECIDKKRGVKLILKYFLAYEGCLFDLGNLIDALGQHHLGYHFLSGGAQLSCARNTDSYRLLKSTRDDSRLQI